MMNLLGFGSAEVGLAPPTNSKIKPRPHQGCDDRLGNWGVTELQIWGSGFEISSGAPAYSLFLNVFSVRFCSSHLLGLQLVCKFCSWRVLKVFNCLISESLRASEITFQNLMHGL